MWTYRQGEDGQTGRRKAGHTDRHYKTKNRCLVTAPINECICCWRSARGKFVLHNKILKQMIDFFTNLRLRCLQTKSICCVNLLWEHKN